MRNYCSSCSCSQYSSGIWTWVYLSWILKEECCFHELWVCLVIWKWNLICVNFHYNILDFRWRKVAGLTQGRREDLSHACVVYNGSILLMGGQGEGEQVKKMQKNQRKISKLQKNRWWTRGRFTTQPTTVGVRPRPGFAVESVDLALPLLGASCLGWVFSHDLGRSHIIQCCVRNVIQSDWFYTSSVTSCSFDL